LAETDSAMNRSHYDSGGNFGNRRGDDLACLAILRLLIEETRTMIAQSRASIDWSRDAIAMLDRLQRNQISN
jgi:hypothetical protein